MVHQRIFVTLLTSIALLAGTAVAEDQAVDEVTKALFEQYVLGVKVESGSYNAAIHLVSVRGRQNGFWKNVLQELKSFEPNTQNKWKNEVGCIRVLGEMLAYDAFDREAIRRHAETGEITARIPMINLGPEVVTELIERGRKADRLMIDHYAVALVRSHSPEAKPFFQSIVRNKQFLQDPTAARDPLAEKPARKVGHMPNTVFHAAIGLAQLGDSEGYDWLIEHSENSEFNQGLIEDGLPAGTRLGMNACDYCQAALRQLSGDDQRSSKADWLDWSNSLKGKFPAHNTVGLVDPR